MQTQRPLRILVSSWQMRHFLIMFIFLFVAETGYAQKRKKTCTACIECSQRLHTDSISFSGRIERLEKEIAFQKKSNDSLQRIVNGYKRHFSGITTDTCIFKGVVDNNPGKAFEFTDEKGQLIVFEVKNAGNPVILDLIAERQAGFEGMKFIVSYITEKKSRYYVNMHRVNYLLDIYPLEKL